MGFDIRESGLKHGGKRVGSVGKRGGKMAEAGSVLFMYDLRGRIDVPTLLDEERVLEAAVEAFQKLTAAYEARQAAALPQSQLQSRRRGYA